METRDRLAARYEEYLDWAEAIGHVVHRPWVPRSTPYGENLELPEPLPPNALPAASRLGYAAFNESELLRLSAIGESSAFSTGWLRRILMHAVDTGAERWGVAHPAKPGHPDAPEDPFADTPGLRVTVVEAIRDGVGRSVDDAVEVKTFLESVGNAPALAVLARVADVADAAELPLPPAAEWYTKPVGIDELADAVRNKVVGVSAVYREPGGDTVGVRGSGFLIGDGTFVGTNRHVVVDCLGDEIEIQTSDGSTLKGAVAGISETADVALIRLLNPDPQRTGVTLGETVDLRQGAPIFTIGFPLHGPETGGTTLSWGVVTAPRRILEDDRATYIQTNYPYGPGGSGSPVFDAAAHPHLIGIHARGGVAQSTEYADQRAAFVSFAVPVEELVRLMGTIDVDLTSAAEPPIHDTPRPDAGVPFPAFVGALTEQHRQALIGAHGALTVRQREVPEPWLSKATQVAAACTTIRITHPSPTPSATRSR